MAGADGMAFSGAGGPLRARFVAAALAGLFAVISWRAGVVALGGEAGAARAAERAAPVRAEIVDRNGELLATSVSVYSLFADPRAVWDPVETTDALARMFPDLDRDAMLARLADRERAFVWIKRGLTPRQRQAVFDLGLEGLGFKTERRRVYPGGSLAGHVLGATTIDGRGVAGVEFSQNSRLSERAEPLRLTLDAGAQFALEAELAAAAGAYGARAAAGVVLDASSGAVRALASWPPVDPNQWGAQAAEARLDRSVGAVFDLGSVFKPFTVAAGFEAGVIAPGDRFDLSQPVVVAGKDFEEHGEPLRQAGVTDIIAHSSNRGAVKIALEVGARRQRDFLKRLGLLDRAPIELAASAAPLTPPDWDELTLATTSFGHGISVSPMAFASAFSAFANGGEVIAPTLLEDEGPRPARRRVMSAPTAAVIVAMLRETVLSGTGAGADVAGLRVAGKTGTAEKVVDGAYDPDRNVTSFAAVFPADDPKFVVFLLLDEPQAADGGGATAAWNAAPAAGRVIERIAPLLGVAPVFDDLDRPGADRRSL